MLKISLLFYGLDLCIKPLPIQIIMTNKLKGILCLWTCHGRSLGYCHVLPAYLV